MILLEEKNHHESELWLNLYTIKKIFGKDIKLKENQIIKYILSNYILITNCNDNDILELFS
ncbi:hypothetical protein [Methanothermococcus okinawensis]|uniref:hypothetical protein n=1 Tax=Methanothermococcus okinawensis TaxID=155863 RepID=UPI001E4FED79|nr:hypothetical protein [Methanothermococcus okinawensis]